jgi:SsrA-binding protein
VGKDALKIVSTNRKARHEYFIEDTLEAGLVLTGTEIKSIRAGQISLTESFVVIEGSEMWIQGLHIATYETASRQNHDPTRPRKLLLHSFEIKRWSERVRQRGYTIIPLKIYLSKGRAKLEIGLAKGKKLHDKRQAIAERDSNRSIQRALSSRRKGQR